MSSYLVDFAPVHWPKADSAFWPTGRTSQQANKGCRPPRNSLQKSFDMLGMGPLGRGGRGSTELCPPEMRCLRHLPRSCLHRTSRTRAATRSSLSTRGPQGSQSSLPSHSPFIVWVRSRAKCHSVFLGPQIFRLIAGLGISL